MMRLEDMRPFIVLVTLLIMVNIDVQSMEVLYDTDNLQNAQYFDCLHYTNEFTSTNAIKYCIQPENIIQNTTRSDVRDKMLCEKGALAHSFSSLFKENIAPNEVLSTFRSGIEQADRYAAFVLQKQTNNSLDLVEDDFICNCSSLNTAFGRYCQYELYGNFTLQNTVDQIKTTISQSWYGQFHRRRMCYDTIPCDFGLLCLDWRNICDGMQNCMDGVDEENCDRLEMNECVENEYRCKNGLCVPEEYWLDGEFDCLDASDELDRSVFEKNCPFERGMECDEHVCGYNKPFPCGDGQCVADIYLSKDSSEGSESLESQLICANYRNLAFRCEINPFQRLWTLDRGFCTLLPLNWSVPKTLASNGSCVFLLKCLLSNRLSKHCPTQKDASLWLATLCKTNSGMIHYPIGSLASPFIQAYYATNRSTNENLLPDVLLIHGRFKCAGFHLTIHVPPGFEWSFAEKPNYSTDWLLQTICQYAVKNESNPAVILNFSSAAPHFDLSCWHSWLSIVNLSTESEVANVCNQFCLSIHRIHDGLSDCKHTHFDETVSIQFNDHPIDHCVKCIISYEQESCIPVVYLDSTLIGCVDHKYKYLSEDGVALKSLQCNWQDTSECYLIRNYIKELLFSNKNKTSTTSSISTSKVIQFDYYCDTYFDTDSRIDEAVESCLYNWICTENEYRCATGQCIPFDWVCNGVWDCSDGSDEQGLFLQINGFSDKHNQRLLNFTEIWNRCYKEYKEQPFANICNITREYPCLLANVDDPLNFTLNPPCIDLNRIGDEHVDCFGKSDERTTYTCDSDILGWLFGCSNNHTLCSTFESLCYKLSQRSLCSRTDQNIACFHQRNIDCNGRNDAMCLNGECRRNARCDRKHDCPNGEDEYWCYYNVSNLEQEIPYRIKRRKYSKPKAVLVQYRFSPTINVFKQIEQDLTFDFIKETIDLHSVQIKTQNDDDMLIDSLLEIFRSNPNSMLTRYLPFICNRGIPIKRDNEYTHCLCSPSYYGDYCEYQADRISVVTHLDLTEYISKTTIIKSRYFSILVSGTFRYKEHIIDQHEFRIRPTNEKMKQKFYFTYPRTSEFLTLKRLKRNGTQSYTIQFKAFDLQLTHNLTFLGAWHFPIDFDFLPAFRFSKILRYNRIKENDSCSTCGLHGKCSYFINDPTKLICICQNGWFGNTCEKYDEQCDHFCHPEAICKPQERGLINGDQRPACLCPLHRFGPTCHLIYTKCNKICQHGGSCYFTYDRSHSNPFECICTNEYYGEYCEFTKQAIYLEIIPSSTMIMATSIQFYDVNHDLSDMYIRDRQIFPKQPQRIQWGYEQRYAPSIILIKSYTEHHFQKGSRVYLVYSGHNSSVPINMSVELTNQNECFHTIQIFNLKTIHTDTKKLVFKYHDLCRQESQTNSYRICFRDNDYFCLCNMTIHRAQCLRFDSRNDECDRCLSTGRCIRGSVKQEQDFLCLCPDCTYGSICQFSAQLFSYTLDMLISKDIQIQQNLSIIIYMSLIVIIYLIGIFNNLCNFTIFIHKHLRKNVVGSYLLIVTIVNIISLTSLTIKLVHILLASSSILTNNTMNLIMCKLISFFLSISIRINYWLNSIITIERLCLVLFSISKTTTKQHSVPIRSSILILIICSMHIHEIIYSNIIPADSFQLESKALLCLTNFNTNTLLLYNRINVLIHHLVPFLIQIISITLLIIYTARIRARAKQHTTNFIEILKRQFIFQKELYLTPLLIIISAIPQIILSLSLSCSELTKDWQRYALLITSFCSFSPQIFSFFIYVLPSSFYKAEFMKTSI